MYDRLLKFWATPLLKDLAPFLLPTESEKIESRHLRGSKSLLIQEPNERGKTISLIQDPSQYGPGYTRLRFSDHIPAGFLPPGFHSMVTMLHNYRGHHLCHSLCGRCLKNLVIFNAKAAIWDAPTFICNILSSGMPTPNPISASKDANHSLRTMYSNKTFPGSYNLLYSFFLNFHLIWFIPLLMHILSSSIMT